MRCSLSAEARVVGIEEDRSRDFGLQGASRHRNVDGLTHAGIAVEGHDAVLALQASIAFDIAAMPVGSGCRTIIDRVQIILLREAGESFRVEVWHSFSDHVWNLLAGICREIELGV